MISDKYHYVPFAHARPGTSAGLAGCQMRTRIAFCRMESVLLSSDSGDQTIETLALFIRRSASPKPVKCTKRLFCVLTRLVQEVCACV